MGEMAKTTVTAAPTDLGGVSGVVKSLRLAEGEIKDHNTCERDELKSRMR